MWKFLMNYLKQKVVKDISSGLRCVNVRKKIAHQHSDLVEKLSKKRKKLPGSARKRPTLKNYGNCRLSSHKLVSTLRELLPNAYSLQFLLEECWLLFQRVKTTLCLEKLSLSFRVNITPTPCSKVICTSMITIEFHRAPSDTPPPIGFDFAHFSPHFPSHPADSM